VERQPAATKFSKESNSLSDLPRDLWSREEMRRYKPSSLLGNLHDVLLPSLSPKPELGGTDHTD